MFAFFLVTAWYTAILPYILGLNPQTHTEKLGWTSICRKNATADWS